MEKQTLGKYGPSLVHCIILHYTFDYRTQKIISKTFCFSFLLVRKCRWLSATKNWARESVVTWTWIYQLVIVSLIITCLHYFTDRMVSFSKGKIMPTILSFPLVGKFKFVQDFFLSRRIQMLSSVSAPTVLLADHQVHGHVRILTIEKCVYLSCLPIFEI